MGLVTVMALPFCFGNGQHVIGAIAPMVLGNAMLLGGISEIILFLMISKVIGNEPLWFSGKRRSYAYYSLKYVVLPILTLSLVGALYQEVRNGFGVPEMIRWGWLAAVLVAGGFLSRYNKIPIKAMTPEATSD